MAELLAEPDYANTIWGSSKVFDKGYLPIAWGQTTSVTVARIQNPRNFPPRRLTRSGRFKRKVILPNFAGRDQKFRSYRTRIRDGMASGPGFAGKMAVVQIGCGTGCSFVLTADTSTGQVFDFRVAVKRTCIYRWHTRSTVLFSPRNGPATTRTSVSSSSLIGQIPVGLNSENTRLGRSIAATTTSNQTFKTYRAVPSGKCRDIS